MSKESALKFLNTLGKNERAKELLKDRQKPLSIPDALNNIRNIFFKKEK